MKPHFSLPWLASFLGPFVPPALAASAPPPANDVVVLSPFTVDTTLDRGYQATNTLSGTRINTSLRDTASSVSVFTPEFLRDIGLSDIIEIIRYSVSASQHLGDNISSGAEPDNMFNAQGGGARKITIRGLDSSQALDYFKSITPDDSYRIGRYDFSRGPNSILFGISDVGGLINQTSKVAEFSRNSGSAKYSFGSNGRNRSEFDLNQKVRDKVLAVSLAGVHQENGGWRMDDYQDKDRLFGSVSFRPHRKVLLRAMGEKGHERRANVAPFTAVEEVLAWLDNRNARGVGAVTFAPTNANPTAAMIALGVVARNGNATNTTRATIVENTGLIFDSAGTYLSGTYNNAAVRAPDGTVGRTADRLRINDPSFFPYEVNDGGPGQYRDDDFHNYTYTAEWEAVDNLFLSYGHNFQVAEVNAHFTPPAQGPILRGDPNTAMGVNGPANPFAGQLFMEGYWNRDWRKDTRREDRLSFTYKFDAGKFGSHSIGGLGSRSRERGTRVGAWLGLKGHPFNANPVNANNRIHVRTYIDENNPATFRAMDWRDAPSSINVRGQNYDVGWIDNVAGGSGNFGADLETITGLVVAQSRFFDGKFVASVGYREDEATITTYGHTAPDPFLGTQKVDFTDRSRATIQKSKGVTRTYGGVYHAFKGVSLIANYSSSIGLPDLQRFLVPNGTTPLPSTGEGNDLGIAFELFDGRITARALRFETNSEGSVLQFNTPAIFRNRNISVMDAFATVLVGTGRPYSAAEWATLYTGLTPPVNGSTFDGISEGYEFSVTANITPNWRLTLNYSKTDRTVTDVFMREIVPWYGLKVGEDGLISQGVTQNANGMYVVNPSAFESEGVIAQWIGFAARSPNAALATLTTSTGTSVAQEIFNMVRDANEQKLLEEQSWGLRPDRFNLFTAYDFTQGRLKGFTVGGGYRFESANIIGMENAGELVTGKALRAADLMLRYRLPLPKVWRNGHFTLQMNVLNLFDEDGIVPKFLADTNDFVLPEGRGVAYKRFDLIEPRSVRFTLTYQY
ncbi:MAG: hypothetical protein Q7S40_01315 [Opitutaceae bacterium]|nr:hypothetical protein [Opitutaceae bacterium]